MQISISNLVGSMFPFYNGADYIMNLYVARVIADGGIVEGVGCAKNKLSGYNLSSQYSTRVLLDGGTQEASACATRAIQELSL
jgi:hypothetical protein